MMARIFFLLWAILMIVPGAAQAYQPGGDPARHDVPSLISEENAALVLLPAGTQITTDAGSHQWELRDVGALDKAHYAIVDKTKVVGGMISEGYLTGCENFARWPAIRFVEVPMTDDMAEWYRGRNAPDASKAWLYAIAGLVDSCAGGTTTIWRDRPDLPDTHPNMPPTLATRSSTDLFTVPDFKAPATKRFAGLLSCPTEGKTDLVWDGQYDDTGAPACRRAESRGEEIVALFGEKSGRFDDVNVGAIQYNLTRFGGTWTTGRDALTGRDYFFITVPYSCTEPVEPKKASTGVALYVVDMGNAEHVMIGAQVTPGWRFDPAGRAGLEIPIFVGVDSANSGDDRVAGVGVSVGIGPVITAVDAGSVDLDVYAHIQAYGGFNPDGAWAAAGGDAGARVMFDPGSGEKPAQLGLDIGANAQGGLWLCPKAMVGGQGGLRLEF